VVVAPRQQVVQYGAQPGIVRFPCRAPQRIIAGGSIPRIGQNGTSGHSTLAPDALTIFAHFA
jgi:hypothetical protein